MSKTKRHGSLIEKNRLLTWRDLELSFNSIAGKIYLMIILVMHVVKLFLRSLFMGIQQLFSEKSHNKENCKNEALVNKRPLKVY